jgi:hypothetical protein
MDDGADADIGNRAESVSHRFKTAVVKSIRVSGGPAGSLRVAIANFVSADMRPPAVTLVQRCAC